MANLKSVQKDVFTLAADKKSDTLTLSNPVDPTKTILFKGGVRIGDEGDRPSHTNIMVSLTNATTITFKRTDSHNVEAEISWYVVEFESGVRVQRGIENFNNNETKTENLASDTDLLKSFCLISYKTDGHRFGADDFCRARIRNDKKIEMAFGTSTTGAVSWQVIEITRCGTVQSSLVTLGGNQSSKNVNIASVDLTKSFLAFSYKVSSEGNPDALAIRGYLNEENQLTFERSADNSPIAVNISWFVVEMTDGTTVQQKDIALAAGTENGDTTIDPVIINKTSVHIGSLQQFGKNERNTDEFGKAMITVELNAVDNVHHERGQANSATGIWTFYVIQWAKKTNNENGGESMFIKGVQKPLRYGARLPVIANGFVPTGNQNLVPVDGDSDNFIAGPGSFISAEIYKQGGVNDRSNEINTFVNLQIDGRLVVSYPFQRGVPTGLTKNNPYGIAIFTNETNNVITMTIGFSTPLYFHEKLKLWASITDEDNITKIVASVVYSLENLPSLGGGGNEAQGGTESPD